jgi:iron complex outermembrane receptor protein
MSVDAVTADTIQKNNIQEFQDVAKLSPGLQLNAADGRGQNVSLRGVTFDPDTGASPTVQVYWNEIPISTSDAFRALFDVQQIEVLKGPQGTLRGQTSPAGAITIATTRPSLSNYGGMINETFGSRDADNSQAAVNIPLIEGKLAIRLAGDYDYSKNGVHNVINGRDDSDMDHAGRISLLWKPLSNLEVLLVHQQLNDANVNYPMTVGSPVAGQGTGPTVTTAERASVTEGNYDFHDHSQLTSLDITWDLASSRLSYVGGLQEGHEDDLRDLDITNVIPGFAYEQDVHAKTRQVSHELRWESTKGDFWNWMIGGYWSKSTGSAVFTQPLPYYFIAPYLAPLQTTLVGTSDPGNYSENSAIFTDHRFALSNSDQIEVGLRYQKNKSVNQQYITVFGATSAALSPDLTHISSSAWTGSANYKHTFGNGAMAYASYSKGFRPGGAVGFITAPGLSSQYYIYKPETTNSYEVGYKSRFFDHKVTFDIDVFDQEIQNYIARANNTWFRTEAVAGEPNGTGPGGDYLADVQYGGANFNTNGNVTSKGIETSIAWLIQPDWTLNFSASYIDAHYVNALLYCNDANNDGIPDNTGPFVQPGRQVSLCKSNQPLADTFGDEAGKLNMTLRSEYTHEIGKYDGFVRGLIRYIPPAYNQQNDFHIHAYTPVDLYIGVRNPAQNWEFSIWAQNLFDKARNQFLNPLYQDGVSGGYYELRSPPEERRIGATLRYTWGN